MNLKNDNTANNALGKSIKNLCFHSIQKQTREKKTTQPFQSGNTTMNFLLEKIDKKVLVQKVALSSELGVGEVIMD